VKTDYVLNLLPPEARTAARIGRQERTDTVPLAPLPQEFLDWQIRTRIASLQFLPGWPRRTRFRRPQRARNHRGRGRGIPRERRHEGDWPSA